MAADHRQPFDFLVPSPKRLIHLDISAATNNIVPFEKKFIDYQWLLSASNGTFSFFDICQMEIRMKFFALC
jgi:hypothetical protein